MRSAPTLILILNKKIPPSSFAPDAHANTTLSLETTKVREKMDLFGVQNNLQRSSNFWNTKMKTKFSLIFSDHFCLFIKFESTPAEPSQPLLLSSQKAPIGNNPVRVCVCMLRALFVINSNILEMLAILFFAVCNTRQYEARFFLRLR